MELEVTKINDVTLIKVKSKSLDAGNASVLRDAVKEHADNGEKKFVLDMAEVEFIDTLGISTILSILKLVENRHCFSIANAKGQVLNVFKITNLKSLLQFHASVEESLSFMKGGSEAVR